MDYLSLQSNRVDGPGLGGDMVDYVIAKTPLVEERLGPAQVGHQASQGQLRALHHLLAASHQRGVAWKGTIYIQNFGYVIVLNAICLYLHLKILLVLILPGGYRTTSSIGSDIGLGPAAFIPMQEKLPWKCLQTMMVMTKRMVNE